MVFGDSTGSGQAGGTLQLSETGTTNVTVTGRVRVAPKQPTFSGGGFGGTVGHTSRVRLLGNVSSTSTSPVQTLLDATGTNTLEFAGAAAETLTLAGSATLLAGVRTELRNGGGLWLGGSGVTATIGAGGTLDLGAVPVVTGLDTLGLASGAVLERAGGRVVGALRKAVGTGPASLAFEIGTLSDDTPVGVTLGQVATPGTVTAWTTAGDHADLAAAHLRAERSVNRVFSLAASTAFDSAVVTLGWPASDVDPGVHPESLFVSVRDTAGWHPQVVAGASAGDVSLAGVTMFGDFAVAEHVFHTITASAGAGGSIAPSGAVVVAGGDTAAFTITPAPGYRLLELVVDGAVVPADSTWTFAGVTADHTIAATFEQVAAVIAAAAPAQPITLAQPVVTVPVTIQRVDPRSVRGFSVTFTVSDSAYVAGGAGAVAEGTFLSGGADTYFQVVDLGGGAYTADGVVLGASCGTTPLAGTLFTLPLGSSAANDTARVTVTGVILRDCANEDLLVQPGAPLAVVVDLAPPLVTLLAPVGGDTWGIGSPRTITWTGADPAGIASVDLHLSLDSGATFPIVVAAGIANTGSYDWTAPDTTTDRARVRVTAHDGNGNPASDTSGDFTIRPYRIVATSGPHGTVSPADTVLARFGENRSFTFLPDSGHHVADVQVDGVSVGVASGWTFAAVDQDHSLSVAFEVNPPVAAITDLTATRVRTGNGAGDTAGIRLDWSAVPAGMMVQVYRAPFGNHPEYDDGPAAGATPPVPAWPPPPGWTLTSVTAPGTVDQTSARDVYFYVAFVTDSLGTRSPGSNRTNGTANYHLADVADGLTPGHGDNHVNAADISLLGSHYGLVGDAAVAPYAYLDIGPTATGGVSGRPLTDDRIDFEDLVLFALDFDRVSAPPAIAATHGTGGTDRVTYESPRSVRAGETFDVTFRVTGSAAVRALAIATGWDPTVVEPIGAEAAPELGGRQAVALSPEPGSVDVALLGTDGGPLAGPVAVLRFRAVADGDPALTLRNLRARDALNRPLTLDPEGQILAEPPSETALAAAAPNPFRDATVLGFSLAHRGPVTLEIFGVDGRRVRTLVSGVLEPGVHQIRWDGRGSDGSRQRAGMYYVRFAADGVRRTRSVVVLGGAPGPLP
jgi:hypothetical protein